MNCALRDVCIGTFSGVKVKFSGVPNFSLNAKILVNLGSLYGSLMERGHSLLPSFLSASKIEKPFSFKSSKMCVQAAPDPLNHHSRLSLTIVLSINFIQYLSMIFFPLLDVTQLFLERCTLLRTCAFSGLCLLYTNVVTWAQVNNTDIWCFQP